MLDFVYKLNYLLNNQQITSSQTLKQLAELTTTSFPYTLQYMSEALSKEIDLTHKFSPSEIIEAANFLSRKLSQQIEAREKYLANRQDKAKIAYEKLMLKIAKMQKEQEWYISFKTMCYFAGHNEQDLSKEIFMTMCSDIIRAGIKSKSTNPQELGIWLERGVLLSLKEKSKESVEDALDLIETYGDFFIEEGSGKGKLILLNILALIEEPACSVELWKNYKNCVDNFLPSLK